MQKEIKVVDNLATREAVRRAKLQSFPENFMYDEFLICTVRDADEEDKRFLENYVAKEEAKGKKIYYPARDTNQVDEETGGYRICCDNCDGMINSRKVSIYWTKKSEGTRFDFGESFISNQLFRKPIKLINRSRVEEIVKEQKAQGIKKSFEMVALYLDNLCKEK